ncbi:hypothetical protein [Pseudomonas putida]|uniref:hypothetical protein n=1 Tax=Pseudomonas putida TaxID=303 RepID=UPI0018D7F42F|nr:hypothetical protein [Pseudomonas putida]MBH3349806.1 hypothetical protein [Pseudomonas putida]
MTSPASVLGVLGMCWVGFGKPTHIESTEFVACRACVLGVLGLCARARARFFLIAENDGELNLYANPEKPNTPNTLNTDALNPLNSLGFECVGFVLALPLCVLGSNREAGDDK